MQRILQGAMFLALCAFSGAAQAETLHTIWELEPVSSERVVTARPGEYFFEQRLLPIRMVRTTEPALDGLLPSGTPLYLVYNEAGQIAFCTVIDRSPEASAKGMFMPIGNKRPCFTDRDGDGRFDATFRVFDLLQNPPKVGGSIVGALPMASQVGFVETDRHDYSDSMVMVFAYSGNRPEKLRLQVKFRSRGAVIDWASQGSGYIDGKWVVPMLNSILRITEATDDHATFSVEVTPGRYIKRVRGGINMIEMPEFLREHP